MTAPLSPTHVPCDLAVPSRKTSQRRSHATRAGHEPFSVARRALRRAEHFTSTNCTCVHDIVYIFGPGVLLQQRLSICIIPRMALQTGSLSTIILSPNRHFVDVSPAHSSADSTSSATHIFSFVHIPSIFRGSVCLIRLLLPSGTCLSVS